MKYKENDEIWIKARIESYNAHRTDSFLPYHVSIEANGKNSDGFLTYINISDKCETKPVEDKCSCYKELHGKPFCSGTKELDECDCDGIPSKCSFYEDVRNKSKERIYTIAEATIEGIIVTAEMYHAVLKDIHKLQFYEIMAVFGWSDYEAPLNKESCIARIIEDYTPKGVVEAYEQWKFTNTVNVGDVIYLDSDKKEYLVTNIVKKNGIVQYHMIAKDFCVSLVGYSNVIEQMPSNAFTKIKSNETIQNYLYVQEE